MKNIIKKGIGILLITTILFNLNIGVKTSVHAEENSVIEIYTVEDLLSINDNLDGDYVLMNDIDLSSISNWKPIGDSITYLYDKMQTGFTEKEGSRYFTGTFDGNGHTIKNLKISDTANRYIEEGATIYAKSYGLFSHVSGGSVFNLIIESADVTVGLEENENQERGEYSIISGVICASCSNATITNCKATNGYINIKKGTIGGIVGVDLGNSEFSYVVNGNNGYMNGGIIGYGKDISIIRNSMNAGNINYIYVQDSTWTITGGIVGEGSIVVNNCYNYGMINCDRYGGGIVGRTTGNAKIVNCVNYGNICCETDDVSINIGGIVGELYGYRKDEYTLINCVNEGDIYIKLHDTKGGYISDIGGIVGEVDLTIQSEDKVVINNCINKAQITVECADECTTNKGVYVGGVFGYLSSGVTASNLYNERNIVCKNVRCNIQIGGIVSEASGNLEKAINYGDIYLNSEGQSSESGMAWIGGVISRLSEGKVSNVGNQGNINIDGSKQSILVGGVLGACSSPVQVFNGYNNGEINVYNFELNEERHITIGGFAGSIIGSLIDGVQCRNFYGLGSVSLDIEEHSSDKVNVGTIYGRNSKNIVLSLDNVYIKDELVGIRYGEGDANVIDSIKTITDSSKMSSFSGFDFDDVWIMENDKYPTLRNCNVNDEISPLIYTHVTNNVDSKQDILFEFYDDCGIAGYYWGSYSDYGRNTYTATADTNLIKTVTTAGTYYLTVKDINGNISDTYSVRFYKTVLNANGGNVPVNYVITKEGNSFTMPIPTKDSSIFNGWSESNNAADGNVVSCTPTQNLNYYATWSYVDEISPSGTISVTNNIAEEQSVTLGLQDNVDVDGYYWGTSSSCSKNKYVQTNSPNVVEGVSKEGTYYLTVKDTSGNMSDTYSITLYKTTLEVDGGKIEPECVIMAKGESFKLPIPKKDGYIFKGWSTVKNSKNIDYKSGEIYKSESNMTLYSIWEKNEDITESGSGNNATGNGGGGNNTTIGDSNGENNTNGNSTQNNGIVKRNQTIIAKSISKTYGSKAFYLSAKTSGNGKLTYTSSNNKVAKVSSTGKVTIKGCGKATIIVNASETSNYKAATKKITITVKPKQGRLSKVTSPKKATVKIAWKKLKGITGYQIQISKNKKFKKGVLQRYFSAGQKTITVPLKNESGKKYYVRIRSYKKTRGRDYYGKWSKVKSVKVK